VASPEKRDGKLTGFWYGEVDRRNKPGGLRFRQRFSTKKEAEGYEVYIKATGEAPPWLAGEGGSGHTFATVAADCKANYAPWSSQKDRSVIQRLEFVCGSKLGRMPIEAITRTHLEALVADLRVRPVKKGKRLSGSTINRYLTAVSTVLTYATRDSAKYGKVSSQAIPWQTEGNMREETLSYDQEKAIGRVLEGEGHTYAFLVHVLLWSGMRLGELMGLKPEQIETDTIRLKAKDVKTKASRLIFIGEDTARELRAIVASGSIPDPSQLRKKFKAAVRACGYSEELCLHSLRHTRATRLLESGVDPQVTMQMMGWKNFTTMQRYRHVNDELQRAAAKKVSHLRGELPSDGVVLPFAAVDKAG
jgi:integrase